jgi:hypothetical protein
VYHIKEEGWTMISQTDVKELHYKSVLFRRPVVGLSRRSSFICGR